MWMGKVGGWEVFCGGEVVGEWVRGWADMITCISLTGQTVKATSSSARSAVTCEVFSPSIAEDGKTFWLEEGWVVVVGWGVCVGCVSVEDVCVCVSGGVSEERWREAQYVFVRTTCLVFQFLVPAFLHKLCNPPTGTRNNLHDAGTRRRNCSELCKRLRKRSRITFGNLAGLRSVAL